MYSSLLIFNFRDKATNCLAEMMNEKFRFDNLTRAERVNCIKYVYISIKGPFIKDVGEGVAKR